MTAVPPEAAALPCLPGYEHYVITESDGTPVCQVCGQASPAARQPDALSRALVARHPELAGRVHYVNGRAWCDGVLHTTRCKP